MPPSQVFVPELRKLNCDRTTHIVDNKVCQSRELLALDRELSALVLAKAKASSNPYQVAADFQFWLYDGEYGGDLGRSNTRNCGTPTCVGNSYKQRIEATKQL